MHRFLAHFQQLLRQLVRAPGQPIATLEILSAEERHNLLQGGSGLETRRTWPTTLPGWFEAQVERTPHHLALVAEGQQLTYRQLDQRANQVAHALQQSGVGLEDRVAICLEHSLESIIALLGVLKTGAAYVPLDPGLPATRLETLLADIQPQALIASRAQSANPVCGLTPVAWGTIDQAPTEAPAPSRVSSEHLAYIIYTSGSTGMPHGVLIEHHSICNLIQAAIEAYQLSQNRRVLQYIALTFDASVLEIFMTLLSGATLYIASENQRHSPDRLAQWVAQEGVTTAVWVPSLLRYLTPADFPSLRVISTGGEKCSAEIAAAWSTQRTLLNCYGPTEATVFATWARCAPGLEQAPPIGYPIPNVQAYVLDARGQLVPPGVTGELLIGGEGLARGYLHLPQLTAERFVPDPFSARPGARLYRTGDLARWREDGQLDYLGRRDEQLKIRGFRVEPGEIEATIQAYEAVQEVIVVMQSSTTQADQLVAYLVWKQGHGSLAALQAFLRTRLPDYMRPAALIPLTALPRSSTGKVDRNALPAWESIAPSPAPGYLPPRSRLEHTIAAIWQEVLGRTAIGRHDNFFDVGGHSLSILQVHARLQELLGRQLDIADLFAYSTVEALAEFLEADMPEEWPGIQRSRNRAISRQAALARRTRGAKP